MCPLCEKLWSEERIKVCDLCNRKLELEKLLPDSYKYFVGRLEEK